ncbi:LITAF domain-containing protein-like [Montipora capricornis]|uniref:LITAF domain-containing protein-like n=1 Tax=Montipora capricornis TaxID=246305 RepID=UPI0035F1114F
MSSMATFNAQGASVEVMLSQLAVIAQQNQANTAGVGANGTPVLTLPELILMRSDKSYGKEPRDMTCRRCHTEITTEIKYSSGGFAFMLCSMMATFGCFLGCCLIPLNVNCTKDVCHFCPNCKAPLGYYQRFFQICR